MDLDLTAGGFCGVVLAGGTAARMDGIDKASVELAGRTLLEYAVDAFLDADEVVVVGPDTVRTARPVTFVGRGPAPRRTRRRAAHRRRRAAAAHRAWSACWPWTCRA